LNYAINIITFVFKKRVLGHVSISYHDKILEHSNEKVNRIINKQ